MLTKQQHNYKTMISSSLMLLRVFPETPGTVNPEMLLQVPGAAHVTPDGSETASQHQENRSSMNIWPLTVFHFVGSYFYIVVFDG